MSTTILSLDELESAYNHIDHIHEGIIDELASLEGGNWGCPVEGTEEIRAIMSRLSIQLFPILSDLDKMIKLKRDD
jgi:hypothetical protein